MPTDLDDTLRRGLHDLAAAGRSADLFPDAAGGPASGDDLVRDVGRRVARRRRRRRVAGAAGGTLAALALASAAVALTGGDEAGTVTADRPPPAGTEVTVRGPERPVEVVAIDAYGGREGTSRLVVTFDGAVPGGPIAYVHDIRDAGVAASVLSWTTQQPADVRVCGDRHWFPGRVGTVDLLIPEPWLAAWPDAPPVQAHEVDGVLPAKVVACGPYEGHVQVGLWGPASDHPSGVDVTVSEDGTQVVMELGADAGDGGAGGSGEEG